MTNPNDEAFATAVSNDGMVQHQPGLTKREYFAALALQGILAAHRSHLIDVPNAAGTAVVVADALIVALDERKDDEN